jgi:hypothetical protein
MTRASTSTRRLSWMQRQRYWVERCFENGKGQCGMADYQVRLWNGWHHHMVLVMMASGALMFCVMTWAAGSNSFSPDHRPGFAAGAAAQTSAGSRPGTGQNRGRENCIPVWCNRARPESGPSLRPTKPRPGDRCAGNKTALKCLRDGLD